MKVFHCARRSVVHVASCVFAASMMMLSGCGQDYRNDPFLTFSSDGRNDITANAGGTKYEKFSSFGGDSNLRMDPFTYGVNGSYYKKSVENFDAGREETAKYYRNALLEAMIVASDTNTSVHLAGLKATQSNVNLIFGAAALGLTGGAAVAPAATAAALAAASTGVQGARALVNEEVYANAFAESIAMLLIEDRRQRARQIRDSYTKSMVEYPIERAIADINEYHERGSVYYGFALARQAIEEKTLSKRSVPAGGAPSVIEAKVNAARAKHTRLLEQKKSNADRLATRTKERDAASGAERSKLDEQIKTLTEASESLDRAITVAAEELKNALDEASQAYMNEKEGLK